MTINMVIFEYTLPGHACHPRTTVLCRCHHLYIPLLLRHLYQSAKNKHVMIAFPSLRFMFKGRNFNFLPFYILKRNEGFCLQIEFSLLKEAQTTLWRILYNSKFNFKKIIVCPLNNAWALNDERFHLLVFLVIQKPPFSNTQFEFITVNNQPTPYYPYDN